MKTSLRLLFLGCSLYAIPVQAQTYCQPTYSGVGGSSGTYIDGFVLGEINNLGTGPTALPGYADYTNTGLNSIATVVPGSTNSATIFLGPASELTQYAIWVDLDRDHVYGPTEQLAYQLVENDTASVTLSITIPADAQRGYTGMRVLCTSLADDIDGPCGVMVIGETEDYTLVIDDGAPCIPVYSFGTVGGDYIDGFQFNTINNIGSGSPNGPAYSDYRHSGPSFITSVAPGGTYTATITSGGSFFNDHYMIWVDLDGDLSFEPDELLGQGFVNGGGVQTTTIDVTIPANAPTGYTSMRMMCTTFGEPTEACGTFNAGETEDYTLVIDDGAPCIPVFGYQGSEGDYVSAVQLEDLNWTVATTPPLWGYDDATASGAHLQAEVTSQLTVTKGTFGGGNFVSVWIDLANDGFDALDLLGTQIVSGSGGTATFDVTTTGAPGYARMRVACSYAELTDACGAADYGHAVDFTLAIGRAGWPCLPLLGYGTQLGDGFTDLMIEGNALTAQTEFPYYAWSSSTPFHFYPTNPLSIGFTTGSYAPETYRAWIDMNDDGDFSDANELVAFHTSANAGESVFTFAQIPANCPPGQHFMRLRANDDANYPLVDPCEDQLYGQIADWVVVVEDPNGPCIPFNEQWTTNGDFIDGVQLGGAQNTGTGGAYGPAYHDYPSPTIGLLMGSTDTLRISSGANGGNTYTAWIDYNDDNDFGDANESLGWIGIADPYSTGDLPFTIPPGTTPGTKHMRVRCAPAPLGDACATTTTGETEDYRVNIELSTGVLAATIADLRLLPTTDGVQLLTDASLIGNSYLLLDATGRTLATGRITADRTDLPMLDFARGAYTVQVLHGDARQVKRFVW
ncbi:MAG: hypothetical protein IPK99_13375 [Flavobacteriales bacterium]|nr:hypothetical protein [Flavobacteriales bacterium]